jgi:hypothetical protein
MSSLMRASSPWFSDVLVQHTKTGKNITKRGEIYQMAIKYIQRSAIARHSKIYPKWDFWFENIPSGIPDFSARWQK